MIKNEIRNLFQNRLLLFVLIVILLIPSIYAGIFLSSMWDPYGDIGKLPVAVVNKDKSVEYKGKTLAVGDSLTESLRESDAMEFIVTDEKNASWGLEKGTYYMVVTIPEDFSANAASVMDKEPKQMVLQYATNPGNNYISSKLGQSAMKEVKANIMEEVTRDYTESVFASMTDVESGFRKAADGATIMMEGEQTLADGASTISEKLGTLSEATLTLKDGSDTLQNGLQTYLDGVDAVDQGTDKLKTGITSLSKGTVKLQTGSGQILGGLTNMQTNLNDSLTTENVKQLKKASDGLLTMDTNIQQLNTAVNGDGTEENPGVDLSGLSTSLGSTGTLLTDAGGKLTSVAGNLVGNYAVTGDKKDIGGSAEQLLTAYQTLAYLYQDTSLTEKQRMTILSAMNALYDPMNQIEKNTAYDYMVQTLGNVTEAGTDIKQSGEILTGVANSGLTDQVTTLKTSIQTLATASEELLPASSAGMTSLLTGMQQVQSGLNQTQAENGKTGLVEGMTTLDQGINTLSTGISGENGLVDGVAELKSGTGQLVAKNQDILAGMHAISGGASQISDGAEALSGGASTLNEGILELQSGTDTLQQELTNGADEVKKNTASEKNIDMFVAPVRTEETQITTVANNGHAMAAYMMSVGLWVGCLAFCLMYPLMDYKGKLKNGYSWWASKAIITYTAAISMAVILVVALQLFNGFMPANLPKTLMVAVLSSICFMSIMYFFNVLLGKVGSFFMLVFMVLQLAGSAGTYPIEISGSLAARLHKYVPFTYTVNAFRSAISGGESISQQSSLLVVLAIVFTILTILLFSYRAKRLKSEQKIAYQWIEEKGMA